MPSRWKRAALNINANVAVDPTSTERHWHRGERRQTDHAASLGLHCARSAARQRSPRRTIWANGRVVIGPQQLPRRTLRIGQALINGGTAVGCVTHRACESPTRAGRVRADTRERDHVVNAINGRTTRQCFPRLKGRAVAGPDTICSGQRRQQQCRVLVLRSARNPSRPPPRRLGTPGRRARRAPPAPTPPSYCQSLCTPGSCLVVTPILARGGLLSCATASTNRLGG